jgi:hypothetical protein
MNDPSQAPELEIARLRARTIAELERHCAAERISPAEFDRRAVSARAATSALELRPLLSDLALASTHGSAAEHLPAHPLGGEERSYAVAIMSGSNLSGQWEPAEQVYGFALMGGVRLDFREAALLEGVVTNLSLFCLMGGCEVIVPPDITVSVSGTGLLGGFGHVEQTSSDPGAAHLHINGLAVLGGVEIKILDLELD